MSGPAGGDGGGVNPNVNVGDEGTKTSSGGGEIGFDDIEVEAPKRKPTPKKEAAAKVDDDDDGDLGDEKKPVESKVKEENKERAPKEKKEPEDGEKKPEAKKPGQDAKPEGEKPSGRAKTFKGKHGEAEVAVSGAATFSIPGEGGKAEDVTMQDLVNEYHGKKYHERTTKRIEQEDRARKKEHEEFNSTIKGFMETAQKDSDAGWDFLAELSGADPVKFKLDLLQKQIAEMLPLAQMDEDELKVWLKDKEREFRDKALGRREKRQTESVEKAKTDGARAKLSKDYGIEDARWDELHDLVAKHKEKHRIAGPVTPGDVVTASRLILADEVIAEAVPHLAKHPKFAMIHGDIVSDLLKDPSLSRERLTATLKEVFGQSQDDNRSRDDLKATAEKIQRNAQASGGQNARRSKPESSNALETWDDL